MAKVTKIRNKKQEECEHEFNHGGSLMGRDGYPPLVHSCCTKGCGYGYLGFEGPYYGIGDKTNINIVSKLLDSVNHFHNVSKLWYAKSSDIEEYETEEDEKTS